MEWRAEIASVASKPARTTLLGIIDFIIRIATYLFISKFNNFFCSVREGSSAKVAPKMDAFPNAGQQEGVEIWRIEDFKPVPYPKKDYGKFYKGDSYVILKTKILKSGRKEWDIHFWLGSETSQDEAGAAAIFAVQLDDQLGGAPIQYRETQEHESSLFLSNFKQGVRYLPGGVASGFQHVDPDAFVTKLYEVKGARNVRVKQVTPDVKSMNKEDCFILDAGKNIYVYVGSKSKRIERLKAINAANQIRDQDHAGKAHVYIVDEFSTPGDFDEFFKALGSGSQNQVAETSPEGDDLQFEKKQESTTTLYRVSDATGKLKIDPVAQKPLEQTSLDSNDCFVLDSGDSNIFVWVGKKCTGNEKKEAMTTAENFLKTKNYPSWTHVQRIVEGGEPTSFTQYFKTWRGAREVRAAPLVREPSSEEAGQWEIRLFHAQIKENSKTFNVEQIYDFDQEDLNADDVMLLDLGTKLYIWIGEGSSVQEKTKIQDFAKEYLKKMGREDTPITRVNQGQEDDKFKKQFTKWNEGLWDENNLYENAKQKIVQINKAVKLH